MLHTMIFGKQKRIIFSNTLVILLLCSSIISSDNRGVYAKYTEESIEDKLTTSLTTPTTTTTTHSETNNNVERRAMNLNICVAHSSAFLVCLGGSGTGCDVGRELYRGEFLCHQNTNINRFTRVGIDSSTGNFIYQEFTTNTSNGSKVFEHKIFRRGNGHTLRLRSEGNLVLRDQRDTQIWNAGTSASDGRGGYQFILDNLGYRVVNNLGYILWSAPTSFNGMNGSDDYNYGYGYGVGGFNCVQGNCIIRDGSSSGGCPHGNQLTSSQFICHRLSSFSNILTQAGLTSNGVFVYREYNTNNSNNSPIEEVRVVGNQQAQRLIVTNDGSLELQSSSNQVLWRIQSTVGDRLLINDNGYRFLSNTNTVLWNGPTSGSGGGGGGNTERGCVPGNCLGQKSTTPCTQGRELAKGQFLCHPSASDIRKQFGITLQGHLVYREYRQNNNGNPLNTDKEIYLHRQGKGQKLRVQSNGSFTLRDSSDKLLWSPFPYVNNAEKLVLDSAGYYLEDDSGNTVWDGPTNGNSNGGGNGGLTLFDLIICNFFPFFGSFEDYEYEYVNPGVIRVRGQHTRLISTTRAKFILKDMLLRAIIRYEIP